MSILCLDQPLQRLKKIEIPFLPLYLKYIYYSVVSLLFKTLTLISTMDSQNNDLTELLQLINNDLPEIIGNLNWIGLLQRRNNDLPDIIDEYKNQEQDQYQEQDQENSITHIVQLDFDEVVANQLLVNNVFENEDDDLLQYIYNNDDEFDELYDNEVIPYDSPIESDAPFYAD